MQLINDNLDVSKYLSAPKEAAKVKPASHWRDAVVDIFHGDGRVAGKTLPWSKTHNLVQVRPGELSLWSGYNYSGKSLILGQVILGLVAQGEKACIASFEMKPAKTLERMHRQFAMVDTPTISYIDRFNAWTDGKLWLYDQQGTANSKHLLAVMRYCRAELGIDQFVIDSLMQMEFPVDDYTAQSRFVGELAAHAMDTGMHVHLVAHMKKGDSTKAEQDRMGIKGGVELSNKADNVYILRKNKTREEMEDETNTKPDATLLVDKNRHGNWDGPIQLWFESNSMQYTSFHQARAIDFQRSDSEAA